uniref:Mitogen-activated protein kinase 4-like n=1 Tax=Rhizophora mucronata TaxID=61149 RepID=A0A2P2JBM3_RHIMU
MLCSPEPQLDSMAMSGSESGSN